MRSREVLLYTQSVVQIFFQFCLLSCRTRNPLYSWIMAAMGSGDGSSSVNVLDLLAAQEQEDKRAELVRRHDTLKTKMDTLKRQRDEQAKQKKALTAALKQAKRQKSRIISKAATLSKDDIVAILCLKNEQESKKLQKLASQAASSNPSGVTDLSAAPADPPADPSA